MSEISTTRIARAPSEYRNEIKCKCGSTQFKVIREGVATITMKCAHCSTSFSLEVDISDDEDGVNPVITFIKQELKICVHSLGHARSKTLLTTETFIPRARLA